MTPKPINAEDCIPASGGYSQACEVVGPARILFVSGQIPADPAGAVPEGFAAQCRQVWANIRAQLRAADMDVGNIVKVTTYLSDRRYADENGEIRRETLGAHAPALTVIIAGIFDEAWLLEIEAVAAA